MKAAFRPKSIELEYSLDDAAQIRAGARQKLQALIEFLNVPLATRDKDFLTEVRPALAKVLSNKSTVNVVTTVENFSARKFFPNAAADPKLNFVVNVSKQNLMFAFLKALGDVNKSVTLFVSDSKTISSSAVTDALQAVAQAVGQDEYAQTVYGGLFFLCTDRAARDVKNTLNACGFDRPKIFSANDDLEQTILNYAERDALPATVRKIYLGVKKKLVNAERDNDKKISDTNESLQGLRKKIADMNRTLAHENRRADFAATATLHFDSVTFDELSRELLNALANAAVPAAARAVEKNLGGHAHMYLKLAAAQNYSQTVNTALKKTLRALTDKAAAHLDAELLTPDRNADQSRRQNLAATFKKILDEKNFELPTVNLESLTLESYEAAGRSYDFVQYVPVDEILAEQRAQAERLLKSHLRKLKTAAVNFASDVQAQVAENFARPTAMQNVDRDRQSLQRAVDSKTKRLAEYKRERDALKIFGERLNHLLEINP